MRRTGPPNFRHWKGCPQNTLVEDLGVLELGRPSGIGEDAGDGRNGRSAPVKTDLVDVGQGATTSMLAVKRGFQPLNHNKQRCNMFPNNNHAETQGSWRFMMRIRVVHAPARGTSRSSLPVKKSHSPKRLRLCNGETMFLEQCAQVEPPNKNRRRTRSLKIVAETIKDGLDPESHRGVFLTPQPACLSQKRGKIEAKQQVK